MPRRIFCLRWRPVDGCLVAGLDLSGEDTDTLSMLPATAVQRLDPPPYVLEERPDTPSFFLCLGADNRCAGAHHRSVISGVEQPGDIRKPA